MENPELLFEELTGCVRNCAYTVFQELGSGFLEKVYENALSEELRLNHISAYQQQGIVVKYKNVAVGNYVADIVIENKIIIEIKAVKELENIHFAQLHHYLKATGYRLGLLINFGPQFSFKRRAL